LQQQHRPELDLAVADQRDKSFHEAMEEEHLGDHEGSQNGDDKCTSVPVLGGAQEDMESGEFAVSGDCKEVIDPSQHGEEMVNETVKDEDVFDECKEEEVDDKEEFIDTRRKTKMLLKMRPPWLSLTPGEQLLTRFNKS